MVSKPKVDLLCVFPFSFVFRFSNSILNDKTGKQRHHIHVFFGFGQSNLDRVWKSLEFLEGTSAHLHCIDGFLRILTQDFWSVFPAQDFWSVSLAQDFLIVFAAHVCGIQDFWSVVLAHGCLGFLVLHTLGNKLPCKERKCHQPKHPCKSFLHNVFVVKSVLRSLLQAPLKAKEVLFEEFAKRVGEKEGGLVRSKSLSRSRKSRHRFLQKGSNPFFSRQEDTKQSTAGFEREFVALSFPPLPLLLFANLDWSKDFATCILLFLETTPSLCS